MIDENVHLAHFAVSRHFHVERVISLSTGSFFTDDTQIVPHPLVLPMIEESDSYELFTN